MSEASRYIPIAEDPTPEERLDKIEAILGKDGASLIQKVKDLVIKELTATDNLRHSGILPPRR